LEYTYFENASSALLHTSLALTSVHYTYQTTDVHVAFSAVVTFIPWISGCIFGGQGAE